MSILRRLFSLAVVVVAVPAALAQTPKVEPSPAPMEKVEPPLVPIPHSTRLLSLAECLEIGRTQQPAIKAAVSSMESTRLGLQALEKLNPMANAVSPDLKFRKCQGEKGLVVGYADIDKAMQETKYDIIRLYYTFVYARQQDGTAEGVVAQLEVYYGVAEKLLDQPGSKINRFNLFAMKEALNEVKKLRIKARTGQSLSLAALKEAMGVEQCFDFLPRDTELPVMGGTVTQDQVVQFALCRRPEIAMASAGVDAFKLEVAAQQSVRYKPKVQTLAIGSDLHSRQVPMAHRNGDYRPGAINVEMPALLVGSRKDRVARACEILVRQDALFDKTRQLVELEAINTFYHWQACSAVMAQAKTRYEQATELAALAVQLNMTNRDQELVIRQQALAGKAQAEYVEAVYEHIKALATLERVTSGGVKPEFPDK